MDDPAGPFSRFRAVLRRACVGRQMPGTPFHALGGEACRISHLRTNLVEILLGHETVCSVPCAPEDRRRVQAECSVRQTCHLAVDRVLVVVADPWHERQPPAGSREWGTYHLRLAFMPVVSFKGCAALQPPGMGGHLAASAMASRARSAASVM